jgi:xanthine dehydrogenase YagS FAD-binding subunit
VRVIGPAPTDEQFLPMEALFRIPRHEGERENTLTAGQVVTHILLPPADGIANATYEVRHGEGPDYPLAAAAAALRMEGGVVREAKVVLGHVAPTPWVSTPAAETLRGWMIDSNLAEAAGAAAVAEATPLSNNAYKVQLAKVATRRALLRAAGKEI